MITHGYGTITPFWENYLAEHNLKVMPGTAMVCVTDMTDPTPDGVEKLREILNELNEHNRYYTDRSIVAVVPVETAALIKLAWPPT